MTLKFCPLPPGQPHTLLLPDSSPDSGLAVFTARPTDRPWAVGQDLLAALGVRHDLNGNGRRHGEDLDIVAAWLRAYPITTVAVRHANNLVGRGRVLDALSSICDDVGADLLLTCEDTAIDPLCDWTSDHGAVELNPTKLRQQLTWRHRGAFRPHGATETRRTFTQQRRDGYPQYLPRADFYAFRAACRDTLTVEQFTMVDTVYRDAFRVVAAKPPGTSEQAAEAIAALVDLDISRGEAHTIVRAAQAAMFTRGHLLKVNLSSFREGIEANQHRRMNATEIRALRAYRHPWRACATVLYDADVPRDTINKLTLAQVDADGNLIGVDHRPLTDDARLFLRAQRELRLSHHARLKDAFLTADAPHVAASLRRIGAELGLPSAGLRIPAHKPRSEQWRYQLGASLIPLTGPVARERTAPPGLIRTTPTPKGKLAAKKSATPTPVRRSQWDAE